MWSRLPIYHTQTEHSLSDSIGMDPSKFPITTLCLVDISKVKDLLKNISNIEDGKDPDKKSVGPIPLTGDSIKVLAKVITEGTRTKGKASTASFHSGRYKWFKRIKQVVCTAVVALIWAFQLRIVPWAKRWKSYNTSTKVWTFLETRSPLRSMIPLICQCHNGAKLFRTINIQDGLM